MSSTRRSRPRRGGPAAPRSRPTSPPTPNVTASRASRRRSVRSSSRTSRSSSPTRPASPSPTSAHPAYGTPARTSTAPAAATAKARQPTDRRVGGRVAHSTGPTSSTTWTPARSVTAWTRSAEVGCPPERSSASRASRAGDRATSARTRPTAEPGRRSRIAPAPSASSGQPARSMMLGGSWRRTPCRRPSTSRRRRRHPRPGPRGTARAGPPSRSRSHPRSRVQHGARTACAVAPPATSGHPRDGSGLFRPGRVAQDLVSGTRRDPRW